MDLSEIHYIKINFRLRITKECYLPQYKTSALRGGVGDVLLSHYCTQDQGCKECSDSDECIVQKVLYAKHDIQPEGLTITEGESNGYIWECPDQRSHFRQGEYLIATLTLFGKCISHLPVYMEALTELGQIGLGKGHAQYVPEEIEPPISHTLSDYVVARRSELSLPPSFIHVDFLSPVSLKHNGSLLKKMDADVFYRAITRRLYMLGCFEGYASDIYNAKAPAPFLLAEDTTFPTSMPRYSARKDQHMNLLGFAGSSTLIPNSGMWSDELLDFLIAGEIIHIGKNTSFGFGAYRLS